MQQYPPRGTGTTNPECELGDVLQSTRDGRLGGSHSLRNRPLGEPPPAGVSDGLRVRVIAAFVGLDVVGR